ncbi:hypothetical protein B0J14DRAFT_507225 [Halenospora varia]|nr:hypothetical protein B0J14DRAFT_507225 [Halenospora varia]
MTLPPELRDMIWRLAMPDPRIIQLIFREKSDGSLEARDTGPPLIPILLHIYHNFRSFARAIYTLGFGNGPCPFFKDRWNPATDTILLPTSIYTLGVRHWYADYTLLTYDSNRAKLLAALKTSVIQHLALPIWSPFLDAFALHASFRIPGAASWGAEWLSSFPSLK